MGLCTVDFSRLALQPGQRVLDLGCGEGRHALTAWLQAPVTVLGLDLSLADLQVARQRQQEFVQQAPPGAQLFWTRGSALNLPCADHSFDLIICSEVLEHIHDYRRALREMHRVLKPCGQLVISVPRSWPERLCWLLSDAYHEAAGGHIRIFDAAHLSRVITAMGFRQTARHWAHALHTPYWWLRCALGDASSSRLVRLWHDLLTWQLLSAPVALHYLEHLLNPLLGKSVVLYFVKADGS